MPPARPEHSPTSQHGHMPDNTELRQALREYEEAAAHVQREIEQIEAGTADGALKIMLEDPVPKRFAQVRQRSGKSFPAAPEIATEALCDARARNVSALESSLIRAHGAFGLGAKRPTISSRDK